MTPAQAAAGPGPAAGLASWALPLLRDLVNCWHWLRGMARARRCRAATWPSRSTRGRPQV